MEKIDLITLPLVYGLHTVWVCDVDNWINVGHLGECTACEIRKVTNQAA